MIKILLIFSSMLLIQLSIAKPDGIDKTSKNKKNNINITITNSPIIEKNLILHIDSDIKYTDLSIDFNIRSSHHKKILQKNSLQNINLNKTASIQLDVSSIGPGFYNLYIKIKNKNSKNINLKLKQKEHLAFYISEKLEVPNPDNTQNNKTLLGIDKDNNGIRDDVQRLINEQKELSNNAKLALKQIAFNYQIAFANLNDKNLLTTASREQIKGYLCLTEHLEAKKARQITKEITSQILNSKERLYANLQMQSNFNGQVVEIPKTKDETLSLCSF